MIGQKYNYLTIVDEYKNERSQVICICKCDCGNESKVPLYKLKSGRIKSCGCMKSKLISDACKKHGGRQTNLYSKWCGIKRRCFNKNDSHYESYGGRGISMCDEWKESFSEFEKWAKQNVYKKGLSLERIDVNGDYCPSNCTWIKLEEQAKNKRNTVKILYNGEQKRMIEISNETGTPYKTISSRYFRFLKRNPDIDRDSITYEMISANKRSH